MKIDVGTLISRIVFVIVVVGGGWWATSSGKIDEFIETTPPLWQEVSDNTTQSVEKLSSDEFGKMYNYFLLGCSALALTLSILYLFIFKRVAVKRNTTDDLHGLVIMSIISVALTCYISNSINWWKILAIPLFCYVYIYPLFYLPYYRYLRWVAADLYALIGFLLAGLHLVLFSEDNPGFIATILSLISAGLAYWFFHTHYRRESCPSCKKHVNILHTDHHIDSKYVDYKDIKTKAATGYKDTYKVDGYGNKSLISSVATGWRTIFYTNKITRINFTDHFKCPNCGYKFTKQDFIEETKRLGYKKREERAGMNLNRNK